MRCIAPADCPLCRAPEPDNDQLLSAAASAAKIAKDCKASAPNLAAEHQQVSNWLAELYTRRTGQSP